jgi:hypothetical protein
LVGHFICLSRLWFQRIFQDELKYNFFLCSEAYVKLERLLKTTDLESERARLDENEKETLQEVNNRVDDLMDTDDDAAADESLLDELASRNRKVPLSKRSLMDLFKESDYDSAARNLASDGKSFFKIQKLSTLLFFFYLFI